MIGAEGEQLGIMTPDDARQRAVEQGLDLVEVAPNSNPPVCRIMDYGKYKYEQKKKKAAGKQKGKGHVATLKEIKIRPKIDEHDYQTKLRMAWSFFDHGDKVKVTLMFRGREMNHKELGRQLMERLVMDLDDIAEPDAPPKDEGMQIVAVFTPRPQPAKAGGKETTTEKDA